MLIRPMAIGLTLCDVAIMEERTRRVSAVNCFSQRVVDGDIGAMPPFYVLAALIGGRGTASARFVVERLDTLEVCFQRDFQLKFARPLDEVRATFRVRASAIPRFGFYQATLAVEGDAIAQKRFSVVAKETNQ